MRQFQIPPRSMIMAMKNILSLKEIIWYDFSRWCFSAARGVPVSVGEYIKVCWRVYQSLSITSERMQQGGALVRTRWEHDVAWFGFWFSWRDPIKSLMSLFIVCTYVGLLFEYVSHLVHGRGAWLHRPKVRNSKYIQCLYIYIYCFTMCLALKP